MTETVNDTETVTMTLETSCPTPSLAFEVIAISGLTVTVKVTTCNPGGAYTHWKPNQPNLSGEDDNAINGVRVGTYEYTFHSTGPKTLFLIGENECGKVADAQRNLTISEPAAPGFGDIVSVDAPASVKHGADVVIGFKIHNTGGSLATFIIRLYQGSTNLAGTTAAVSAGLTTSEIKFPATKAPATGTSVTYTLKSYLET